VAASQAQTVLVVEDEASIASFISLYLKNAGYRVKAVSSGGDALAQVAVEQPALIVLDLMLPDMDGIDVCRRIRQSKDIPILMLVSPKPDLVGLATPGGAAQSNLLGAYETLDYLKQGPAIIHQVTPQVRSVGLVYNPAEPQSVLALDVLRKAFAEQGLKLEVTPVNSSSDSVVSAPISKSRVPSFSNADSAACSRKISAAHW